MDPQQIFVNNSTANGGFGRYDALFLSVRKSISQGLDFSLNYTWSHGISTAGEIFLGQQNTGFSPPSSFDFLSGKASNNGDRRHVINATWYYELPFGKGKQFSASNNIVNRIIGGWHTSGIWLWATGTPVCIGADGDYGAIDGFNCAIGARLFGKATRHNGVPGSSGIGTNGTINLFANPAAVFNSLRAPQPGIDGRPGAESLNAPRLWNVDLAIGKNLLATERFKMMFTVEFFNAFNHPLLGTGASAGSVSLDLGDPKGFGVLSKADNNPRNIQIGLQFKF